VVAPVAVPFSQEDEIGLTGLVHYVLAGHDFVRKKKDPRRGLEKRASPGRN
jgi:hypothetical protein